MLMTKNCLVHYCPNCDKDVDDPAALNDAIRSLQRQLEAERAKVAEAISCLQTHHWDAEKRALAALQAPEVKP
jgi:hypothetical protein